MEKRLFVGNLPFSMGEQDLESSFANHGTVVSAVIIRDRDTGQSRGFGFVEMETEAMAELTRIRRPSTSRPSSAPRASSAMASRSSGAFCFLGSFRRTRKSRRRIACRTGRWFQSRQSRC
ncbi:MAG: RNA-binding protein [Acidobacteriota bacterium]